jgi:phage gpG-like protein
MSGLKFTFSSDGDKLISRELLDISGRALDLRPAFRLIADDFRVFEAARFDSRGEGTWKPLLPQTVREKARKGQDPRILHATLSLRNSLTVARAPGSYSRVYPNWMEFGTNVSYAKFLQTGTRYMPARKPLGFTEAQKVATMKRLQRFVVSGDAGPALPSVPETPARAGADRFRRARQKAHKAEDELRRGTRQVEQGFHRPKRRRAV